MTQTFPNLLILSTELILKGDQNAIIIDEENIEDIVA